MVHSNPVLFIDSGVGGLSYLEYFHALAPEEPLVYVADRAHFPYGPRPKSELIDILLQLVKRVNTMFQPKLIIIACNTASVSALSELRSAFSDLPFIGTVPAVKPAALSSKKRRIGVLATERTVQDPYIVLLSERFAPDCSLFGIAAPELVDFVEKEYPTSSDRKRKSIAEGYIQRFHSLDVDALVLGCTHFLFLSKEFAQAAGETLSLFDSRDGVARRALYVLEQTGTRARSRSIPAESGRLFLTGDWPIEPSWNLFASLCNLRLQGILGETS